MPNTAPNKHRKTTHTCCCDLNPVKPHVEQFPLILKPEGDCHHGSSRVYANIHTQTLMYKQCHTALVVLPLLMSPALISPTAFPHISSLLFVRFTANPVSLGYILKTFREDKYTLTETVESTPLFVNKSKRKKKTTTRAALLYKEMENQKRSNNP